MVRPTAEVCLIVRFTQLPSDAGEAGRGERLRFPTSGPRRRSFSLDTRFSLEQLEISRLLLGRSDSRNSSR